MGLSHVSPHLTCVFNVHRKQRGTATKGTVVHADMGCLRGAQIVGAPSLVRVSIGGQPVLAFWRRMRELPARNDPICPFSTYTSCFE